MRSTSIRSTLLLGLICAAFVPPAASAQSRVTSRDTLFLDSLLKANSHRVQLASGRITGPGADLLLRGADDAQFFMIGESHYGAETPEFASALFDELHRRYGYNYYAVEYGPTIMRMMSESPNRGSERNAFRLATRYPHAFQFWDDEEIASFVRIGSISSAKTHPIWGLDNEWGALHVLDRLSSIAPSNAARRSAQRIRADVFPIERARPFGITGNLPRWISGADSARFDELRRAFAPGSGSEADRLIAALETSNRIYRNHGRPDRGYAADSERERLMKTQFMTAYRAAERAGDRLPRVLLKFGTVHAGRGFTPSFVTSLGTFVDEFAVSNGMTSFSIAAWLINKPGDYWTLIGDPEYGLYAGAGSPEYWSVVDLRPLRPLLYAGKLPAATREVRRTITAYDALLLIGSGKPGTFELLQSISEAR